MKTVLAVLGLIFGLSVTAAHPSQLAGLDVFTPKGPILMARTPMASFKAEGSATFLSGFGSTNGPAMLLLNLRGFSPGITCLEL